MSLLKAIKAQLGLSNTPANNFTITAEADNGTLKLARGNAGATTQDILTVGANGVIKIPQNVIAFDITKSGQAIGAGSGLVKSTLDTANFNVGGSVFDSTTNNRITPSVAGYYAISYSAALNSVSGNQIAYLFAKLAKNSVILDTGSGSFPNPSNVGQQSSSGSRIVFMNGTTDYLELICTIGVTGNCTLDAVMSGYLLGAA